MENPHEVDPRSHGRDGEIQKDRARIEQVADVEQRLAPESVERMSDGRADEHRSDGGHTEQDADLSLARTEVGEEARKVDEQRPGDALEEAPRPRQGEIASDEGFTGLDPESLREPVAAAMRHNDEEVEVMTKGRIVSLIALLALVASACGASPQGGPDDTNPAPESLTTTERSTTSLQPVAGGVEPVDPSPAEPDPGAPLPEQPEPKVSRAMQGFVDLAIADLASRLDIPAADITVTLAEHVVWPDGSLGCPQPGMVYTQVLVDGSRAILQVGQTSYSYHGGGIQPAPFLCENPSL